MPTRRARRSPPSGGHVLTQRYRLVLSAVHMVYRLVNATDNVRELSLRLTRLLCQFIKAHSASVHLLDPEKKRLQMVAIFDNKINILLDKQKDLQRIPVKERRVSEGYSIFEARLIGLPLVAAECVGATFVRRTPDQPPFTDFDREMLSVVSEQAVTAVKNLQLYEQQQKTILSSIHLISKLLERQSQKTFLRSPAYFTVLRLLAEKLHVSQEGIERLYYASLLRDAGAIDVPYQILAKTSRLSPEEFKVIRNLPAKSAELIRPVEFLRPILPIILYHHEHYDGSGYPSGLKKEQIPKEARIMAVVDAFEAMTRGRPYREKLSIPEAVEELRRNSGTQFDPMVVEAFCILCQQKRFRNHLARL